MSVFFLECVGYCFVNGYIPWNFFQIIITKDFSSIIRISELCSKIITSQVRIYQHIKQLNHIMHVTSSAFQEATSLKTNNKYVLWTILNITFPCKHVSDKNINISFFHSIYVFFLSFCHHPLRQHCNPTQNIRHNHLVLNLSHRSVPGLSTVCWSHYFATCIYVKSLFVCFTPFLIAASSRSAFI